MYTSAEIALLRAADPGVVIPGIDTPEGNPLSSLTPVASMPASGSAFYYIPAENEVVVNQAGAVLSGYNFGSATISIRANNVTIKDSTFQAGAGEWYSIVQAANVRGAVIENNTFNGGSASNPLQLTAFIDGTTSMSVLNNTFLNAPGNAINTEAGTVSGNFISGGGYSSAGKHPDFDLGAGDDRTFDHQQQFRGCDLGRGCDRGHQRRDSLCADADAHRKHQRRYRVQ